MRIVTARKDHVCSACGEVIDKDEECWQSEGFYGRFFHRGCYWRDKK